MTTLLFRQDAYLKTAPATVIAHHESGIILDQTNFYARGGGQPGDCGKISWAEGEARVQDTIKGDGEHIVLCVEDDMRPEIGTDVTQTLDWDRRHRIMRVHTALHLLSVVVPLGVTGGSISPEKGRLDFNMPDPPEDKAALEAELNALISRDLPVSEDWITDAELEANPGLVKTMSVKPPSGAGRVRLIRIGAGDDQVDLQPCGGTHVARTSEIGPVRIGKVEKKGAQNRRINIHIDV